MKWGLASVAAQLDLLRLEQNGVHFSDPRLFYRSIRAPNGISNFTGGGVASASDVAGFFTNMATSGISIDSNWTLDTFKTLLSVTSGAGLVSTIIGPTGLAGTPTTTVEVTVDGILYPTFAITATAVPQRAMFGTIFTDNAQTGSIFTVATEPVRGAASMDAGKTTQLLSGGNVSVPNWPVISFLGSPCLIFRKSLLIRMKTSENNSTTANQERQSAVQYRIIA